jgi:acetaldehyde dehydrogenase/alcohol dehydrogenase
VLYQPTIFFGEDAELGLASFPGSRVAVISSDSLKDNIKDLLITAFKKKSLKFIKRSWKGEPDMEGISGSIAEMERFQPDVVIAVGGGSVIDGTKLCRLYYEFPYFEAGRTRLNQLAFKTSFIAIPTTVGSGAEGSSAAVYINKAEGRKEMIVSHDLQPSVVVLNPENVSSAPENVIISSALDAVAHIVEGYISVRNNNITDIYAEKALSILYHELPGESRDYQKIQYAGYLGGIVQNHCVVGAAHAIAHQVSEYGYSHGDAVALLLPSVLKVNAEEQEVRVRLNKLCSEAGLGNEKSLLDFIDSENECAGILSRKKDLYELLSEKVKSDRFVENVMNDMGGKGNPIPITVDYIEKVVRDIGDGL